MQTTVKITVIALCLGLATALVPLKDFSRDAELSLMRFMTQSRDVSDNPQRSIECFSYYVPLLSDCTDDYESNYKDCCNSAAEARSIVDNDTLSDRNSLEASAKSSCDALEKCNAYVSSLDFFECYKTGGDLTMKQMFIISSNASATLASVQESFHLIEGEQDRCTNESEREYIETYSKTFTELQSCTQGKTSLPEPSNPITTETPDTTFETSSELPTEIPTEVPTEIPTEDSSASGSREAERAIDESALPEEDLYNIAQSRLAVTFQKLRKHF